MNLNKKMVLMVIIFLVSIGFGIYSGTFAQKNSMYFNIHRVMAMVTVIYSVNLVVDLIFRLKSGRKTVLLIIMGIISVLCLFTSGTMIWVRNGDPVMEKIIHNISAAVLFLCLSGIILLMKNKVK